MTELSKESMALFEQLLSQPDVQARKGLRKGLEDLLAGRKPKPRTKGEPNPDAPDAVTIALIGCEGGGIEIHGRRYPKCWRFFSDTSESYYGDEEHHATSREVGDISELLPDGWPDLYPVTIHPEFVEWFRWQYELTVKNNWDRFGDSLVRNDWMRVLYGEHE